MKRFEGLRRTAAELKDGGWTIGYGHTVSAREGASVTAEEAEALLIYDLRRVAHWVRANVYTPLNQNQFDALCAFAFNIGEANFLASAVLKRLNEGSYLQAAAALELWRRAEFAGEDLVVDALVRRRAAEKALFLTPPDGFRPTPTPVVRVLYDPSILETMEQSRPSLDPVVLNASLEGALATLELQDETPRAEPLTLEPEPQADDPPAGPALDAPLEVQAEPVAESIAKDGSATLAAAASVKSRLERLFAEDSIPPDPRTDLAFPPPPAASATEVEAAPLTVELAPGQAEAEPETAPPAAADPEPPPPPFAALEPSFAAPAPPPAAPSSPVVEPAASQPAAPPAFEDRAEPSLFDPATAYAAPVESEAVTQGFGRRSKPVRYSSQASSRRRTRGNRTPYHPLMLLTALLGVAFFSGSIVAMLTGKATFAMLGVGIVGIILMAPCGVRFLLNRLEEQEGEAAPE